MADDELDSTILELDSTIFELDELLFQINYEIEDKKKASEGVILKKDISGTTSSFREDSDSESAELTPSTSNTSIVPWKPTPNDQLVSTSDDSTNEVQQHPFEQYNWQNNGNKRRKQENGGDFLVEYYICGEKKRHNCPAVMIVNRKEKKGEIFDRSFKESHNHPPPNRKQLNGDVKHEIKKLIALDVPPSKIQKEIMLRNFENDNINPGNTPLKRQIVNFKAAMKASTLPTGNSMANVMAMHGHTGSRFLHRIELYPVTNIILCHPDAPSLIETFGDAMIIDSTFDFVEMKLNLTTAMIFVKGIGIPVAYFLSDGKTAEDYSDNLSFLKNKILRGRYAPTFVLSDFETAFQNAVRTTWPSTLTHGDLFHFMQCNTRWLRSNGAGEHVSDAILQLRILCNSPTLALFKENLSAFISYWTSKNPSYVRYFTNQWCSDTGPWPPASWALFGRRPDAPSGDQALEAYHQRLNTIFTTRRENLDIIVNNLYREFEYFRALLSSEHLLQERLSQISSAREKVSKRTSLRDYYTAATNSGQVFFDRPSVLNPMT
eukprot:Pompholyxophrys_sp_v1_NODE_117_length_1839_cov_4.271300.p1 type:complete len:548 gc:universal NODE_117_length_1839_cov_4.271300:1672-29(-)